MESFWLYECEVINLWKLLQWIKLAGSYEYPEYTRNFSETKHIKDLHKTFKSNIFGAKM